MKLAIAFLASLAVGLACLWPHPETRVWEVVQATALEKIATPATAVFGPHVIEQHKPGVYVVAGYIDAENLYGATVREKFNALVYAEDGEYTIGEFMFDRETQAVYDHVINELNK